MPPALLTAGESLLALMLIVDVAVEELALPSLTIQEMVRLVVDGFSDELLYVIDSRALS